MSANILIVEDEDVLRKNIADTLRARGFSVDEAGDGEEGLERIRAAEGGYAAIVCDVAMPLLDGLAMLKAAADVLGQARVLLLSAYAVAGHDAALPGRMTRTLPKPVAHAKVADEVAGLLAA